MACLPSCLPCLPFPAPALAASTSSSAVCVLLARALSGSRCRDEASCRLFLRFLQMWSNLAETTAWNDVQGLAYDVLTFVRLTLPSSYNLPSNKSQSSKTLALAHHTPQRINRVVRCKKASPPDDQSKSVQYSPPTRSHPSTSTVATPPPPLSAPWSEILTHPISPLSRLFRLHSP
jgi:hypothetical protein